MLEGGYLTLGRAKGVSYRVHLLAPLGWAFFNRLDEVRWLGMFVIVLLHELGHAWVVRRFHARVVSIDFVALGGECRWLGEVSARGSATIAWGGVAAQALLLAVAAPVSSAALLTDPFALRLLSVFTWTNLLLIGLNLLPIPPLDGSRAWSAIPLWWRHWRRARREARHRVVTRQLEHLDRAAPPTDEAKVLAQKLLDDARRDLKN